VTTTTMTPPSVRFAVEAFPTAFLQRVRAARLDDFGNPLVAVTAADQIGGRPLRCCLRDATEGEEIALIAYRPPGGAGPFSEVGPVFIHLTTCDGYQGPPGQYPEGFRRRQQVFRGYGRSGRIVDAVVSDGADAESAISTLFANPNVDVIQSRNVGHGCFMFLVCRGSV
jgi:hypothetical protein